MTDDERQKLINSLKTYQGYDRELNKLVHDAADEIERLEKENKELYRLLEVQEALAQSDAEPASGLIEAAELLELCARRSGERQARWFDKAARLLRSHHADSSALADVIETRRTRAADRSTK